MALKKGDALKPEAAAGESLAVRRERQSRLELLVSGLVLAGIYAILVTRFDLRLLFTDTTLTGGDTASWFQVLKHLKEEYLPRGRLFGYSLSNFFGYMEGQQYFILPFLAAALLGYVMPLTVALKVATVAGGFALPLTMFLAGARITGKPRGGAFAASFGLLFLFNESYTIFGGNWLSTFAGEFCFSWAIAILPLFVASITRDRAEPSRKGIVSGLLLGLIGLCHFFVFMPAFFLPFLPAFRIAAAAGSRKKAKDGNEKHIIARIGSTYLTALLLMAFWLVPMAATRTWAQPISMLWHFSSAVDFARQTLAWVWLSAAFMLAASFLFSRDDKDLRSASALLLYGLGSCAFLFFAAPGLGMPDIRFVPTALVLCALGAALLADRALRRLPSERVFSEKAGAPGRMRRRGSAADAGRRSGARASGSAPPPRLPLAALLPLSVILATGAAACAGAAAMARNAPAWFRWNYTGYEAKTEWPSMAALERRYRTSSADGRFLWEKQDQRDNRDFGSERAFENLSLFLGYPTSEGIHYGSSFMARAATYLQSSYSPNPVDPEAERIYSIVDPASWPARFSLLNAKYIITHSQAITSAFEAHQDFSKDFQASKFSVFAFDEFKGSYVSVIPREDIGIVGASTAGFKTDYYRFFREYRLYPYPFVSAEFADQGLRAMLSGKGAESESYDSYRSYALAKAALDPDALSPGLRRGGALSSVTAERIGDFSIVFDTSSPGEPHYIRIAYAPGWKSKGGERIYPASPGFMLIIPGTGHVELVYGWTIWEILGAVLTGLLPIAALFLWRYAPGKKFPWRALVLSAMAGFAAAAAYLIVGASAGYPAIARDIGKARTIDLRIEKGRLDAERLVAPWATQESLDRFDNRLTFDAYRIKASIAAARGQRDEAAALLETLRSRYPDSRPLQGLPSP